jgi:hypothetical protein
MKMKTKIVKSSDIDNNMKRSLSPSDYIDDNDDMQDMEMVSEAFARGGMTAVNEYRGHDSYNPEPCGHHCDEAVAPAATTVTRIVLGVAATPTRRMSIENQEPT